VIVITLHASDPDATGAFDAAKVLKKLVQRAACVAFIGLAATKERLATGCEISGNARRPKSMAADLDLNAELLRGSFYLTVGSPPSLRHNDLTT